MNVTTPYARRLYRPKIIAAIFGAIALWVATSQVYAAGIEKSIDEIKALIAKTEHCEWRYEPPHHSDHPLDLDASCEGADLKLKNGEFETLQMGYANPDDYKFKDFDIRGFRENIIKIVQALFPQWKDELVPLLRTVWQRS